MTAVRPSTDRLASQARNPPAAFLVCMQLQTGTDDIGVPQNGAPFLTVIQAPSFTPTGRVTDPAVLQTDHETLQPAGLPIPEDPIFFAAASVSPDLRYRKDRQDYIAKDVVLTFGGLSMCDVGWTATTTPAAPDEGEFFRRQVAEFANVTPAMYVGTGAPPTTLTDTQSAVLITKAFPLQTSHLLPAGVLWDASIGSRDFLASLQEIHNKSPPEVKTALSWVDSCSVLHIFLDTVATNTRKVHRAFCCS